MFVFLALLSLIIELTFGYPDRLFRAIGHPVTWIGRLIDYLDQTLNRPEWTDTRRRMGGVLSAILLVLVAGTAGFIVQSLMTGGLSLLFSAVVASSLIAQRSLFNHVEAVVAALENKGLEAGRKAVAQIVGRDTAALDEAGVARAAIESLAENFSDGVMAPVFWLAVFGLPGAAAYKAINTADSMIGHRTPRHEAFGWAAARLDDLVNLPASRLSALLFLAAAVLTRNATPAKAWSAIRQDAVKHRSPNAGWPEAAMAGALGLELAGPRIYGGVTVEDAYMGAGGRRSATVEDIRRALQLCRYAAGLLTGIIAVMAVFLILHG